MNVYRFQKNKYSKEEALSGYGAFKTGGRWNKQGTLCVYSSESISLALLEIIVHINISVPIFLEKYNIFKIHIPDSLIVDFKPPSLWNTFPITPIAVEMSDNMLKKSLAMKTPSVIIPQENNYIINPAHPEFSKSISVIDEIPFYLDHRIIRTPKM